MTAPLASLVFYLAIIYFQGVESATPSSGPDQEAACSALQQIADRSSLCSTTSTCTQLHCSVLSTTTDITVLPCATPPSVSVVTMQGGREIYSHVFSQSQIVPITTSGIPILNLNVSLAVSPNRDSMVLEVNAIPILGQPISIIPRTTIPLSRSQCNSAVTFSGTTPTSASSDTTPTSAQPVQHAQTCQALQSIARGSAGQCNTVNSCTALDCNFLSQYHARLTVKPCNNPPAVGVVIEDVIGDVIVDETLVDSRTQPINWQGIHLFDLIINITHMQNPDAIVLKVSIHSTLGRDIVVVPDTPIPINRCDCPGVPCISTDSPSDGTRPVVHTTRPVVHTTRPVVYTNPTAGSSKQSGLLLVKIVVPLGVLVLLSVATIAIVIVGVVYSKRKRSSSYNFQRVAFSNGNEEEDEEGLADAI